MNIKLALNRMSSREQLMVLVTCVILIGGAYGGFRFYPAHKAIAETIKNTAAMDTAVKTGSIPEEPAEDVETLKLDLADIEAELEEARLMVSGIENILSPADTTELRLAISDLARASNVLIKTNEEYRVEVPPPPEKTASGKQQAQNQPKKRMGDAAKRRARNQAREARRASRAGGVANTGIANVSPEQTTALVRKIAVNGPMERPMQRLTVEGTYGSLQRFITDLESLEKMVTIVYLQMTPTSRLPPPGYNQRISASLVLAL
jgi:hypothetical protein